MKKVINSLLRDLYKMDQKYYNRLFSKASSLIEKNDATEKDFLELDVSILAGLNDPKMVGEKAELKSTVLEK